jgi:hypothetical protein
LLRARGVGTTIIVRPLEVDVLNKESDIGEILDNPSSHLPIVDVDFMTPHVDEPSGTVVAREPLDVVDCGR